MLVVAGLAIVLAALAGCTTRPQTSETLELTGNHTAGDLFMVTADTAAAGYKYIEPDLSPDGTRIVFSIDWPALPPVGLEPDLAPLIRQLAVIDLEHRFDAETSLSNQGAALVELNDFQFRAGSNQVTMRPNVDWQKGSPCWLDDDNIVYWLQTPRGARLYRSPVVAGFSHGDGCDAIAITHESDDDQNLNWRFWEHLSPSVSPDGRWIAFSKYGHTDADSLHQATGQSIWVCAVPEVGVTSGVTFQVTSEAALCDGPSWSPDGRKLVFFASLDLWGSQDDYHTHEIFTVDFDTTGYAQNGAVELDRELDRLTFSPPVSGSAFVIRNESPVYSADGTLIAFVSDRRVPTITLTERNIWHIPADGSLDPSLLFFSRSDDTWPVFTGGPGRELLLTSGLGFPTELMDAIWQEVYDQAVVDHPELNELQLQAFADDAREELAFFEDVMTHLYVLSNW